MRQVLAVPLRAGRSSKAKRLQRHRDGPGDMQEYVNAQWARHKESLFHAGDTRRYQPRATYQESQTFKFPMLLTDTYNLN